jgi:hypothetical protein
MAISRNWTNLRDFLRKTYNREVNEWFRDVDDPIPDNSTSRKQAKRACLILPKETQNMALLKMLAFRYQCQEVHLRPDIVGVPYEPYQETVVFRPQIHLFFLQDSDAVPDEKRPIEGQIGIRLVDETSATMTEAKGRAWAVKIKREFSANNGYIWKKGKVKCVCKDPASGLDLQILALNETEGIEVIKKIYDLVDKPYDENLVRIVDPKKTSVTNPTTSSLVYGKQRKDRRWRPVGNVRFQYATLTVHGMQNRIMLVDRTRRFLDAYEWG